MQKKGFTHSAAIDLASRQYLIQQSHDTSKQGWLLLLLCRYSKGIFWIPWWAHA